MQLSVAKSSSLSAIVMTCMLTACGGGSSNSATPAPTPTPTPNSTMTLSGIVTDSPIGDAKVLITIGDQTFETTANHRGEYELEVSFSDGSQLVQINAIGAEENGQENIELISIAGSAGALFEQAGDDQILTSAENMDLNATHLSTAMYLLAKDLNNEQGFTGADQFSTSVEQVNTDDLLQTAGMIKLIIDNPDYASLLENNLLTVFDSDDIRSTMNALSSLVESADLAQASVEADIVTAINETISDGNVVEGFTYEMLEGKTVLQLPNYRQGFIPHEANATILFSDMDKAKVTGRYSPEGKVAQYKLEEGKLVLDYPTASVSYILPDERPLGELFGEEVENAMARALNLGLISTLPIEEGTRELIATPISINKNIAKVRIEIKTYLKYVIDESVIEQFPILADLEATSTVTHDQTWYLSVENGLESNFNFQGKWALSVPRSLSQEINQGFTFSPSYLDALTLSQDGSVTSTYADTALRWAIESDKLVLTSDENKMVYTPFLRSGNHWLAQVDIYQANELVSTFAGTMAKFNESASKFTENLITELPDAYLSHLVSDTPDYWDGDKLFAHHVYGYLFEPDGNLKNGISTSHYDGVFQADWNWKWEIEGTKITLYLPQERVVFSYPERIWDVISMDDDGKVLVVESEIRIQDMNLDGVFDEESFIMIAPRLNILLKEDLSKWASAWENHRLW